MKVEYAATMNGLIQGQTATRFPTDFQFTPADRLVINVKGLDNAQVAMILRAIATIIENTTLKESGND